MSANARRMRGINIRKNILTMSKRNKGKKRKYDFQGKEKPDFVSTKGDRPRQKKRGGLKRKELKLRWGWS